MNRHPHRGMPPRPYRPAPALGPPRLGAKHRALAQWHGLNLQPLEISRQNPAQSAGDILPGVLGQLRMDRRQKEAEITRVWNHLIDPAITAHAQPSGLARGTLFITVDSNVWLSEIVRYRRHEILNRLQHSFGSQTIARLSLRVG